MAAELSVNAVWGLLLLVGIAAVMLWAARGLRQSSGLPSGKVAYSDTGAWQPVHQPLYSAQHQLTGKPDYIVRQGQQLIPVEVKSTSAPANGPYETHVYQLAAYCLLVHSHYGVRPTYGVIKYADRSFEVDYTPTLEGNLLNLLTEIRDDLTADDVARSHCQPARCQRCGVQHACDQSLI